MGMYISLYKKIESKFIRDASWEDQKYVDREKVFDIIMKNGVCIDETQPYSDIAMYWRPTDFEKCREEINKLKTNKHIFLTLLKILEVDENLYITYD